MLSERWGWFSYWPEYLSLPDSSPETGSGRVRRERLVTIINNEYLKIISTVVLSDLLGVGVGWSPYLWRVGKLTGNCKQWFTDWSGLIADIFSSLTLTMVLGVSWVTSKYNCNYLTGIIYFPELDVIWCVIIGVPAVTEGNIYKEVMTGTHRDRPSLSSLALLAPQVVRSGGDAASSRPLPGGARCDVWWADGDIHPFKYQMVSPCPWAATICW